MWCVSAQWGVTAAPVLTVNNTFRVSAGVTVNQTQACAGS